MPSDRGTITRVDLQVEYPDGRVKKVTLSDNPADNEHNHHRLDEIVAIGFRRDGGCPAGSEHLIGSQLKSSLTSVEQEWDRVKDGDDYKPAMMLFKMDGAAEILCGGHRNGHNTMGKDT